MQDQTVAEFAEQWFEELSDRAPVDRLLERVTDAGLDMAFPERTLTGHEDFTDWYRAVGELFADQTHVIEQLHAEPRGDLVDVDVTVVWAGVETADGSRFAFRVNQNWTLRRGPDGKLRIQRYRVGDFVPLPAVSAGDA